MNFEPYGAGLLVLLAFGYVIYVVFFKNGEDK